VGPYLQGYSAECGRYRSRFRICVGTLKVVSEVAKRSHFRTLV